MKFNPLKKINDAKNSLTDTAKTIGGNSQTISELSDKALDLLEMLKKFVSNDNDTKELQNLSEGTLGKIIHKSDLHNNANDLLVDLRKLINNINDNPDKYNINITLDKKIVDSVDKLANPN